jgi:hypothetical protein
MDWREITVEFNGRPVSGLYAVENATFGQQNTQGSTLAAFAVQSSNHRRGGAARSARNGNDVDSLEKFV